MKEIQKKSKNSCLKINKIEKNRNKFSLCLKKNRKQSKNGEKIGKKTKNRVKYGIQLKKIANKMENVEKLQKQLKIFEILKKIGKIEQL